MNVIINHIEKLSKTSKYIKLYRELWQVDNLLTFRFWGVIGTSCGENFGYLDKIDSDGNHFIGYYNTNEPEQVYLVASSFDIFMSKFLKQIENNLMKMLYV